MSEHAAAEYIAFIKVYIWIYFTRGILGNTHTLVCVRGTLEGVRLSEYHQFTRRSGWSLSLKKEGSASFSHFGAMIRIG